VPTSLALGTLIALFLASGLFGLAPSLAGPGGPPATASPTIDPTASPTPSPSPTPAPTPTPDLTPSPTPDPTPRADPTPTPTPPPAGGLPDCRYANVPTLHTAYDDWRITLLDTIYALPRGYAPGDLVDTAEAGLNGGFRVRRHVIGSLAELAAAARAAGHPISVVSAYRSYDQQKTTFDHWVEVGGLEEALRTSARPGHSEHQLGTAVDLTTRGGIPPWEYRDWAATATGGWVADNAWRYGFVMSYPYGAGDVSCYDYEPWHYRYVGQELAAAIHASGAVPREAIWGLQ
jgi:D-alanyl-D-alanine carboxypeptidase